MSPSQFWLLTLLVAHAVQAQAQTQYAPSSYAPSTPPISPWMNLWQRNVGPFDNYNSVVGPELRLRDVIQQQNMAIQQNQEGIRTLGNQWENGPNAPKLPTGTGSVFMNYSHYYPGIQTGVAHRSRR